MEFDCRLLRGIPSSTIGIFGGCAFRGLHIQEPELQPSSHSYRIVFQDEAAIPVKRPNT